MRAPSRLGLRLVTEENDRDSVDVFVESTDGRFCSSYAMATNEGVLTAGGYPYEDLPLTRRQLEFLESDEVQNFLAEVGY